LVHYHICWSDSKLDWQAFDTPEDARIEAEKLVLSGESYTIDSFANDCPRCKATLQLGDNPRINREYDIFEQLRDGCPIWRKHAMGLVNTREKLKEIGSTTPNQCFAMYVPTKEIVARVNVKDVEDDD